MAYLDLDAEAREELLHNLDEVRNGHPLVDDGNEHLVGGLPGARHRGAFRCGGGLQARDLGGGGSCWRSRGIRRTVLQPAAVRRFVDATQCGEDLPAAGIEGGHGARLRHLCVVVGGRGPVLGCLGARNLPSGHGRQGLVDDIGVSHRRGQRSS